MRLRAIAAALTALFLLTIPASSSAQRARPRAAVAQRDWSLIAVRTPEGGFRVGNPAAPVKLVEYLSLTCPHCAEFAHQGSTRLLQDYVRRGGVSVEYRNYVLNAYDLAAAFLSRCAQPRAYFDMSHELLLTQAQWMGRMQSMTDAQRNELRSLSPLLAMQRIVALLGLQAVAARHGISPAQQNVCLANQAGLDQIGQVHEAAERLGVTGTPTFFINGNKLDVSAWPGVEARIRGAMGG